MEVVEERFLAHLESLEPRAERDLDGAVPAGDGGPSSLTGRTALALFEAQASSRLLDHAARDLRARGEGFYTIGSSGHEGNAVLGELLAPTDLCFLHYRSGALVVRRLSRLPGETPLFDILLSMCASCDDPVAGGRHKVWGSKRLHMPPQTSTIASHVPKAVGAAFSLDRGRHLGVETGLAPDGIVLCSFGDASLNHSTTQGGINAALWASHQGLPVPLLMVCEDNGIGISVRTPPDWVESSVAGRPGMAYFRADGRDLVDAYETAKAAIAHCRDQRAPTFLHLSMSRLFGHAGSDVETAYHSLEHIEAEEAGDPLLGTAELLVTAGIATPAELRGLYEELRTRIAALSDEAASRPRHESAESIMAPLAPYDDELVAKEATRADYGEARREVFGDGFPEDASRPRHLAMQLNLGLRDMLAKYPRAILFGEDVAKKGGVYHVTDGLERTFGGGRVFNTLLDEQTILGLAMGAAHVGHLPIPEIQFLAYLHNAQDQLRGEAASLQFFSGGQWQNPMLLRIASFGYQRGFGGHFHNDGSIAALRDIPGVVLACPSRGDDAVGMLRTAMALCAVHGRVVVMLEPIALYMEKDLYEQGDRRWLFPFPAPGEAVPVGRGRVVGEEGSDLTIVTYANGVRLALQAAKKLREEGVHARVVDLRWLAPLDEELICQEAAATGRVVVVDEGRRTGGVAEAIVTCLVEGGHGGLPMTRVTGKDTFVPLGDAWRHVLPSTSDIVTASREVMARGTDG